ncbi:hypothetical protein ACFLXH_04610 [Chloroflexota bacterium]
MKQEIKYTVDPNTGEKSIKMNFSLEGMVAYFNTIAAHSKVLTYWDWWNEQKWLHKYWAGYEDFLQADSPNRLGIMLEAAAAMKSWFSQGVKYLEPTLILDPEYYDEPEALPRLLKIAQGKILSNILEYKRIPEYLRPQILMWTSARGYGKGGIKASFEWKDQRLGNDIVYGTEGVQPGKRVDYIISTWYDYACHRLYGFVGELYAKESDEWKRPKSLRAVEKYLDAEQRLKELGLDLPARLEYYARWLGYQITEVSEMLEAIGINKSVDAVTKSYQRNKELIRKNTEKT